MDVILILPFLSQTLQWVRMNCLFSKIWYLNSNFFPIACLLTHGLHGDLAILVQIFQPKLGKDLVKFLFISWTLCPTLVILWVLKHLEDTYSFRSQTSCGLHLVSGSHHENRCSLSAGNIVAATIILHWKNLTHILWPAAMRWRRGVNYNCKAETHVK